MSTSSGVSSCRARTLLPESPPLPPAALQELHVRNVVSAAGSARPSARMSVNRSVDPEGNENDVRLVQQSRNAFPKDLSSLKAPRCILSSNPELTVRACVCRAVRREKGARLQINASPPSTSPEHSKPNSSFHHHSDGQRDARRRLKEAAGGNQPVSPGRLFLTDCLLKR